MTPRERQKMDLALARFAEAMEAWNWSKRTVTTYRECVGYLLDWICAETDLDWLGQVTPDTLSSYQVALVSFERKDGSRLASATQHLRLTAVKAFFRYLAESGHLLTNPATQLSLPRRRRSLPQALLSPKEAARLIEATETKTPLGLRDRAILEVLYASGIRNAELRALCLSDFDPEAGTLTIRAGKGNKDRVVPLGPLASAVLSDYIAQSRPVLLGQKRDVTLFLSKRGRPIHSVNLAGLVAKAARRAGIGKPIRPHRLRHACATHMLKGGADIRHIQKMLGHASLASTQIYTHVEISDLKAVHRKFHPRERQRR
ncbi:MAG: tyrosine-type recombinase/integrase [Rubrobacteraceae bacterium]